MVSAFSRSPMFPNGIVGWSLMRKGLTPLATKSDCKMLLYPNRQAATNSPLSTVLTDYANAGGQTMTFTNLLGNDGNMIDSNADNRADGWIYSLATPVSCIGNEATFLPTSQYGAMVKPSETRNQNINDILYLCAFVKSTSSQTSLQIARGTSQYTSKSHSGSGAYEFLSAQATLLDKTTSAVSVQNSLTSGWTNISVKQAHLFNLTTIFGAGKEPTQAWMDAFIQKQIAERGYINVADLMVNNDVTITNLAGTTNDGYENTPFISDIGNEVRWTNLLGVYGNMVDSNADNRADGWIYSNASPVSCTGNEAIFLPTSRYGQMDAGNPIRAQSVGDIIYFCAYVKSFKSSTSIQIYTGASYPLKNHSGGGLYEFLSAQGTLVSKSSAYAVINEDASSSWTNISVKQAHLFNLTTMFPDPANRPTQEQMDRLVQQAISIYGYINDVYIKMLWQIGLKADGTDTYGVIGNNGSLNFIGTQNFAFTLVFIAPTVLQGGFLFASSDAYAVPIPNIAFIVGAAGDAAIRLNGLDKIILSAGSIKPNTGYVLRAIRLNGYIKAWLNNVLVYNSLHADSILPTTFTRILSRINNATGTAHATFFKGTLLSLTAHGANVTESALTEFANKAHQPYKATISAFRAA